MTYVVRYPCPSDLEHSRARLRATWRRAVASICIPIVLLSGCLTKKADSHIDGAPDAGLSLLESLAERISVSEAVLAEKEALARAAEHEARFSECRAQVAEATAEFALARVQCLEQLASEARCKAEVEREKGQTTLSWCGLGILVAFFSGGSAAPWALGGCFAGQVLADSQARECGTSDCAQRLPEQQQALMKSKGWSELPQCGGRLGLEVETPLITLSAGVRVTVPGLLGSAGIRTEDVVVSMKKVAGLDTPVPTKDFVPSSQEDYDGMAREFAGGEVEFGYVRDEHLYVGRAMIPQEPGRGRPGVEPVASVWYRWGARVTWVAPWIAGGSRLAKVAILGLDGRAVTSRDHLRELLRYRRAGERVTLQVRPEGASEVRYFVLTLGERTEPVAL